VDNIPGDKLGVWRDMRLADALVLFWQACGKSHYTQKNFQILFAILTLILIFDNQTDFVLFVTIDFTHYSNVLYKSLRLEQKTNITPLNILPRDQLQPPARLHSRLLL